MSSSEATTREYIAMFFVALVTLFLVTYAMHCVWATSEAYSSPSIVLSARSHDGSRIIFDDFREAYWWLRMVGFIKVYYNIKPWVLLLIVCLCTCDLTNLLF